VIAAVILFERYEQKDKSGKNALALRLGNAQIKKRNLILLNKIRLLRSFEQELTIKIHFVNCQETPKALISQA
jgi:hypothetical protein